MPEAQTVDVMLRAQRNRKAWPLLGVLEPGQTEDRLLQDGDIRTDLERRRRDTSRIN
ncbi:MAG: hypothetical protein PF501_03315 [Salinisphaera sp.]|nr:hypothetical protein [Salinisphaera sp.]